MFRKVALIHLDGSFFISKENLLVLCFRNLHALTLFLQNRVSRVLFI